ncbi:MAG: ComF family protein [Candidatus Latescibacteria bacterium]|nr:ComF family protein [Candidatus Latescibacterota bacterium]
MCARSLDHAASVICVACAAQVHPIPSPYCERCSTPLDGEDAVCRVCAGRSFSFVRARAAVTFDETVQTMIHLLKYRGRRALGRFLGRVLAEAAVREDWFREVDLLVPVPLHRSRARERGYNQSELLARGVADRADLPLATRLLTRHQSTRSQTTLTPAERAANVRGAFRVIAPHTVAGTRIALVDDVFTTGATFDSCAHALLDGGAAAVYALAVARA